MSRPNPSSFRSPQRSLMACVAAISMLAACGGGGGDDADGALSATAGIDADAGGGNSGAGATTAVSGNVTCAGLTIGAARIDNLTVPDGASCTLLGTRLNGTIEVGNGATLFADSVSVNGNLKADGAAELRVTGASSVGGSLQVQRGARADVAGVRVTGDIQIDAMRGPASFAGNQVGGSLQAVGNRGGVTLVDNRMNGNLQCKENLPPPTGSGNVAALKEDQCSGL